MDLFPIHVRGSAGGYDYVLAGRCTAIVHSPLASFVPGAFRTLLARTEQEVAQAPQGFRLVQAAFLLPALQKTNDPFDLATAGIAYLRRHPELEAHYTLTPASSLLRIAIDIGLRAFPRFDARLLAHRDEVGRLLRKREPDLPAAWYDLPSSSPPRSVR
jgi:hypothetical protein